MRFLPYTVLIVAISANAQSVDISQFYYRDYLDFGQNKGAFGLDSSNSGANLTLQGKNGASVSIPHTPNFQASSNYGSLTAIGRGFAVSANHVVNFTPEYDSLGTYRKFGLTTYQVSNNSVGEDISQPFGRDEKFARFDKYIIEGQVEMLDIDNSISQKNDTQEAQNIENLKAQLNNLAKDSEGNVYLYQAGSGVITLRNSYYDSTSIDRGNDGETRGGGFGYLKADGIAYGSLVHCPSEGCSNADVRGMYYTYVPNVDFNNRITSGDSGSGIYAYDSKNNKWILLGVTSQETASNIAYIAAVSNKDFESYKSTFEQKIDLKITEPNVNEWTLQNNTLTYQKRGDTPDKSYTFEDNKDIIFSGSGEMTINVAENIERNKEKVGSGGFVFTDSSAKTTYKFINAGDYYFYGSGLDIGQNVEVDWHLRNKSGDFLHKIGQGTLIVKTQYDAKSGENLGYLKVGEGKVVLDSAKKSFEGIYITSGRATIDLKQAESIGAVSSADSSATKTYTLAQDKTSTMGFYFGTGGGKLDLQGNHLVLNTIAAQDFNAIITNTSGSANLEIQGFGYENGTKSANKANTIIHASFSDLGVDSSTNSNASLNLIHKSDSKNDSANLIFDGNINTSGSLSATNANITLQGHTTTHATISDANTRDKIISAESGTSSAMPSTMDLSRPSTLQQSDWDTREFSIQGGIDLKNANLNIGRNARVNSDISADSTSKIVLGNIVHFIDKNDGKNVGGSGFSYYQNIESGAINDIEAVNKSISYNGKITLNGGEVKSSIYDFNAKLDLKNSASLNAEYLVLTSANASDIKLTDSAKATIQTLVIKNLSDLNAFNPIANGASGASFAVQKGFIFDNATFDLSTLDSTNGFTKPTNYDITAKNNSSISANNINITNATNANISIDSSSKLTLNNNGEIKAQNSTLTLALDSAQNLNLNASGTSKISLKTLSESSQDSSADSSTTLFSGKIIASDSSVIDSTALKSISASVDLKSSAKLSAKNITLDSTHSTITLDSAHLEASSFASNAQNLGVFDLKNGANLSINTLDLGIIQSIKGDSSSNMRIATLNSTAPKTIESHTTITQNLNLSNVGAISAIKGDSQDSSQNPTQDSSISANRFSALNFTQNLTFSEGAKIQINLDSSVNKSDSSINLGQYYAIVGAQNITDNRADSRIDFTFGDSVAESDKFFVVSKITQDALLVKFLASAPNTFSELNKQISHAQSRYSEILQAIVETNPNDEAIDIATRTDNYGVLNQKIQAIDNALNDLAQNNQTRITQNLLFSNDSTINTRIAQVRLSQKSSKIYFAHNSAMYRIQSLIKGATRSDAMPSYAKRRENLQNSVWLNVGGGYFGGGAKDSAKMGFGATNIGYDRIFNAPNGDILLGAMVGVGGSKAQMGSLGENALFYNAGLYLHTIFNTRGGEYGGHELQSNLNISINDNTKSYEAQSAKNLAFGTLFSVYYKYNFIIASDNASSHALKPVVLLAVGHNRNGAYNTGTYKQGAFANTNVSYGFGVEYNAAWKAHFYSVGFVFKDMAWSSSQNAHLSLSGARNFIGYSIESAPRFSAELNLVGSHKITPNFYVQYGIAGMFDSSANYGAKGDVKFGYRF